MRWLAVLALWFVTLAGCWLPRPVERPVTVRCDSCGGTWRADVRGVAGFVCVRCGARLAVGREFRGVLWTHEESQCVTRVTERRTW